jgi:threonine/homoserine/homoserine lactone efflux protein
MPPLANLLAFAITALVIVVIPGPSVMFVIGRSLSLGRRGGLLSVVGNALGFLPQVTAVAVGVGVVVAQSVVLLSMVKFVGAAYLVYLGVQAIRHRNALATAERRRDSAISVAAPRRRICRGPDQP